MKTTIRSLLLGGAAFVAGSLALSSAAFAQADHFNGGGSSLAGKVYVSAGQLFTAAINSNFFLSDGISSSGTGTTAFISNNDCLNYPGGTGCPGATDDYAASDAYLSSSNLSLIQTALGNPVVQIPMFATPVTIAFNLAGFTTDGSVTLNDNDLCLIFSGTVTNWSDSRLSQNASSTVLPNEAITVIYRSDGSGTSNLFTTHLANACTPTPSGSAQGKFNNADFAQGPAYPQITANAVVPSLPATGNNTFSVVFTGTGGSGTVPSNFTGASGSGGVQAAIQSTAGAVGYLSPDYTDIAPINAGGTFPPVASVDGVLPTSSATSSAFSGVNTNNLPTTAAQLANVQNFSPLVALPASGSYPIVGYTYWFLSQCYASTSPNQATDVKQFLGDFLGTTGFQSLVTLNGFANLNTSGGLGKVIATYLLKNTAISGTTPNVDIGDSTVCAGGKGR